MLLCSGTPRRDSIDTYISRLASEGPLSGASIGVLAVNNSGDTLACRNALTRMVPASNAKLITCGAALHALGADFRFPTDICYSGHISDGVLHGDLYISGGGDPTTGAAGTSAIPQDVSFAAWRRLLTQAGIRRIEGRIIGDSRSVPRDGGNKDWSNEDMGFYYGSVPEGLNFHKNKSDLIAEPGPAAGDPVSITERWPHCPWMVLSNYATTAPAGTGDKLMYHATPLGPYASMSGTLAVDRGLRVEECVNPFGAWTCAAYFYKYLSDNGIKVDAGWADIAPDGRIRQDLAAGAGSESATAQQELTRLGSGWSAPLRNIIKETLWESDNFYAEALLKRMGLEYCGSSLNDSCLVAEKRVLRQMGAAPEGGARLRDGSGLARTNYVTPEYLVNFLKIMLGLPEGETFISALPSAGQGTLALCLTRQPLPLKSRVRMKSGSMDGVRCYSGYILPAADKPDGETVIFSIMVNNATARSSAVIPLLDRIILMLAQ